MLDETEPRAFPSPNRAYDSTFEPGQPSFGLVVPLEAYPQSAVFDLAGHLERARLADDLGFSALWLRDVPFHVPSFGEVGQVFNPFVYLGAQAA